MLPLYLLTATKSKQILVELKNGETITGDLLNCDSWMNLTLMNVIQTSISGDEFIKLPEIYIRGNHIKYLRLPEEIMDYAKEQTNIMIEQRNRNAKGSRDSGHFNNAGRRNPHGSRNGPSNRRNNQIRNRT